MFIEKQDKNIQKLLISTKESASLPDKASKGAYSKWLENDIGRMRILTFPPGYEGDHICYKGHSIYVISGKYRMYLGESVIEWEEGDSFIIPNGVPHRSTNPGIHEVRIVMFDKHRWKKIKLYW